MLPLPDHTNPLNEMISIKKAISELEVRKERTEGELQAIDTLINSNVRAYRDLAYKIKHNMDKFLKDGFRQNGIDSVVSVTTFRGQIDLTKDEV